MNLHGLLSRFASNPVGSKYADSTLTFFVCCFPDICRDHCALSLDITKTLQLMKHH